MLERRRQVEADGALADRRGDRAALETVAAVRRAGNLQGIQGKDALLRLGRPGVPEPPEAQRRAPAEDGEEKHRQAVEDAEDDPGPRPRFLVTVEEDGQEDQEGVEGHDVRTQRRWDEP